jgi:hypothetical protein
MSKSGVWEHFKILSKVVTKCQRCGKHIQKKCGNTTAKINNLKSIHNIVIKSTKSEEVHAYDDEIEIISDSFKNNAINPGITQLTLDKYLKK